MDKLNKKIYHIKLSKRSPEGADRTINVLLTNILCAKLIFKTKTENTHRNS